MTWEVLPSYWKYLLKDSLSTGMYLFRNGWGLHLGNYSNKQMGMSVTKSLCSRAHGGWKGSPPSLNELCLGTSSNDYTNLSSVWTHEFWNGFQSCENTVLKYRLKAGPWCLRTNRNYFYLVIQKVHDQKSTKNFFYYTWHKSQKREWNLNQIHLHSLPLNTEKSLYFYT